MHTPACCHALCMCMSVCVCTHIFHLKSWANTQRAGGGCICWRTASGCERESVCSEPLNHTASLQKHLQQTEEQQRIFEANICRTATFVNYTCSLLLFIPLSESVFLLFIIFSALTFFVSSVISIPNLISVLPHLFILKNPDERLIPAVS